MSTPEELLPGLGILTLKNHSPFVPPQPRARAQAYTFYLLANLTPRPRKACAASGRMQILDSIVWVRAAASAGTSR